MDSKLIFFIIIVVIVFAVVLVILNFIKKITKNIKHTVGNITKITNTFSNMDISSTSSHLPPQEKTVGGATNLFLPKIISDFPTFHNPDAENDIKSVTKNYLEIIHGQKNSFQTNTVNKNTMSNVIKKENGTISNVNIHRISIYNYQKTLDYATITYRLSVGYQLNNKQIETRYEIQYTLQIKEQGVVSKALLCDNCGASLEDFSTYSKENPLTKGICPYCNTKIIRDTIMSWMVSDIKEIP